MSFDLDRYLARIGLNHPRAADADALFAVQRAQLETIPFENTEPLLGVLPDMTPDGIWTKAILQRRGGYCLELNALLGRALVALGFHVAPVLGRVRMGAPRGGPRAHLAHLVTASGRTWLCDAGFGGPGPVLPVDVERRDPFATRWGTFRLREDRESGEVVLERATSEGWFALYGFDRSRVSRRDIHNANRICATGEMSPFPRHLMMYRALDCGRISLFDHRLRQETDGGATERVLQSASDLTDTLESGFGLPHDPSRDHAIWAKLHEGRTPQMAG